MSDINDFSDMRENFDTIKTLLNSIRAQGILNTSDVDKLLAGINSKLEKINTDEDIDLIKAFLSELKQSLDERHNVLVSKFGAIESLFSNLLKNSNDSVKTSELKELFDIVATNLSVFSREVVSQKESLSDITLRLDAMRSDDSQKKDIIKSVVSLKHDLEKISNGFDSIVLSLNENFKTVLKTISEIDQSEAITEYGRQLTELIDSTSTILSAIQLMDKKNNNLEENFEGLATQEDVSSIQKSILELSLKSRDINDLVDSLVEKSYKIDNLAEKIDASVNIIAGLKAEINDVSDDTKDALIERLNKLEDVVRDVSTEKEFEQTKMMLNAILDDIANVNKNSSANLNKISEDIKEKLASESDKLSQLLEVNISRTINDIVSNTENLNSSIKDSRVALTGICEKSFADLTENITGLRTVVAQIDENNVSANNAIFSNITDRLAIFENSLRNSLEKQETNVSNTSSNVYEQVAEIKDIAEKIDYRIDTSSIEIADTKREFEILKNSIDKLTKLDFVSVINDVKTDLKNAEHNLKNAVENNELNLSDSITSDLFGKYELIVSKIDSTEVEIKSAQTSALSSIKDSLDNISSQIIDVLSYVSVTKDLGEGGLDNKFAEITKIVKDTNLNYVENVRDIVDVIRTQVEQNLKHIAENSDSKINQLSAVISESNKSIQEDIKNSYEKLTEVQTNFDEIKDIISTNKADISSGIKNVLTSTENVKKEFETILNELKNSLLDKITELKKEYSIESAEKISELKFNSENLSIRTAKRAEELKEELKSEIDNVVNALDISIQKLSDKMTPAINGAINQILDSFVTIKGMINATEEQSEENLRQSVAEVKRDFAELRKRFDEADAAIDEDLSRQITIIEGSFESLNLVMADIMNQGTEAIQNKIRKELSNTTEVLSEALTARLEHYKAQLEILFDELKEKNNSQSEYIETKVADLNNVLEENLNQQNRESALRLDTISAQLKDILADNQAMTAADYNTLKNNLNDFMDDIIKTNDNLVNSVRAQLDDITKYFDTNFEIRAEEISTEFEKINASIAKLDGLTAEFKQDADTKIQAVKTAFEEVRENLSADVSNKASSIIDSLSASIKDFSEKSLEELLQKADDLKEILFTQERTAETRHIETAEVCKNIIRDISSLQYVVKEQINGINTVFTEEIKTEFNVLDEKLNTLFENNSISFVTELTNNNNKVIEDLNTAKEEFKTEFIQLKERLDKDELSRMDFYQSQMSELNNKFNLLAEDSKASIKSELEHLVSTSTEISAGEIQSMENFADRIMENVNSVKQNSILCKDLISKLLSEKVEILSKDIEKETDVIVADIIEQFSLIKDTQKDDLLSLTASIEGSVSGYIVDAVNDLKSYLDIKADSNDINTKIDNLKKSLELFAEETLTNVRKLLERSVFSDAISDLKATNEVLMNSMVQKLNNEVLIFVQQNLGKRLDDKFSFFDKRFTDALVEKYEEVKLLSAGYNKSFEKIAVSVQEIVSNLLDTKEELSGKLKESLNSINGSIDDLRKGFADLKAQILNKSLDEAFHDAVHNQIAEIEKLSQEQLGYIQDISDLCCNNLPELTEMNTLVKYGIMESIKELQQKVENQQTDIPQELNSLKTDIITQILNVFNQISFIAEQEEIIDYIQEKHSELITILSHIVNTSDSVETVKDNLAVVDNKIDSLKEDIDLINEKITAIMSSEGDIDYVYSLQDLESDIAALRVVLNEMKADNKSKEFEELIGSTNNIYKLVETIKEEMPSFEADEFKKDFETLAEDIVSISTRTNKLILTSDESYKTLQDNLQDFKLVINDLDERTRNFPKEAGIDKIDNKLALLNTMIQNGAKTNQVFNQVFEYLAEWVDKAGAQITAISDKVETLDEIGQIRVMLEDMRAQAEDNSESVELIDALTNVFDKQAKRIASMEAKIDRLIVENTISKKDSKINLKPIEETINRFLVAIDDRMSLQQDKINLLDKKLEEVVSLVDNKDTAQLTKKVGGMDKQLAKLNKSIEKIASNVVEK